MLNSILRNHARIDFCDHVVAVVFERVNKKETSIVKSIFNDVHVTDVINHLQQREQHLSTEPEPQYTHDITYTIQRSLEPVTIDIDFRNLETRQVFEIVHESMESFNMASKDLYTVCGFYKCNDNPGAICFTMRAGQIVDGAVGNPYCGIIYPQCGEDIAEGITFTTTKQTTTLKNKKEIKFLESCVTESNTCATKISTETNIKPLISVTPNSTIPETLAFQIQGKPKNRKLPFFRLSICKIVHAGRVGQFPIFGYSL